MSSRKGAAKERELVNELHDRGFAVIRAPASGGATTRELPDVLAGDDGTFYAIEAKYSTDDLFYVSEGEVNDLTYFAENFGARPLVGARYPEKHGDPTYGEDTPGWYFHHPRNLTRTDGGNYRVRKSLSLERGLPLRGL
jgi:Holliday junction resolvase